MKIAVCSDLHLEFGPISLENTENADVLILSGDICVARDLLLRDSYDSKKSNVIHNFFLECCSRFKNVVYVVGNHEHYHGDFAETHNKLNECLGYLSNLYILNKDSIILNDVIFVGGTLWTDMNKEDPKTMNQISYLMNDFRIIQNSNKTISFKDTKGNFQQRYSKFSPEDCVEDHKAFLKVIDDTINGNPTGTFVVVGHHAPSKKSTKPGYEKDLIVGGAYSSDLDEFILSHPQIKAWVHGHTHDKFDYMIGSTRIVSNARGYVGYERGTDKEDPFFPMLIEV